MRFVTIIIVFLYFIIVLVRAFRKETLKEGILFAAKSLGFFFLVIVLFFFINWLM